MVPNNDDAQKIAAVQRAVDWFNEVDALLFVNNNRMEMIKQTLLHCNVASNLVTKLSRWINEMIVKLTSDIGKKDWFLVWERKLYIYDNKKQCQVAFMNNKTGEYVDHYGNRFLDEMMYLQTYNKFSSTGDCLIQNGEHRTVDSLTNVELLQRILECFNIRTLPKKDSAFKRFLSSFQFYEHQALMMIKKIQCFFRFFVELDSHYTMFIFKNDELHIIFRDFSYYLIGNNSFVDDWENFKLKIDSLNVVLKINNIPDARNICELAAIDHINLDQHFIELNKHFQKSASYTNICWLIAVEIVMYLKNNNLRTIFNSSSIKNVAFFISTQYADEKSAVEKFTENSYGLKTEFYNLMEAVMNSEKSEHRFPNHFSEAYHFSTHYRLIGIIINNCIRQNYIRVSEIPQFPEWSATSQCAKYYLKHLPDYMFKGSCKRDYNELNQKCQNYYFQKQYRHFMIPILGIKIKFLDGMNEIAVRDVIKVYQNDERLNGTIVSTIHERRKKQDSSLPSTKDQVLEILKNKNILIKPSYLSHMKEHW